MLASLVVDDQLVGDAQNRLGAAVVLFQPHDFDIGIVLFKIQNVPQAGAAPAIDGLIGVPGHGQIAIRLAKPFEDEVLGRVGILILIDDYVAKFFVELAAQVGVFTQ